MRIKNNVRRSRQAPSSPHRTRQVARFGGAPADLGDDLELRDCYHLTRSAAEFEAASLKEINRPNIMWRVQNRSDIVCRVPPSASLGGDLYRGVLSGSTSILNYSHICIPIKFEPKKGPKFYEIHTEPFNHSTRVVVVQESGQGARESVRDVCFRFNKNFLGWLYS
ncbi:BQ2448_8074 [Microbotryum intermedium]|uniref:BQ2448_8074 protein n=1 Tax=Microbotryum intermedium TaxID=269621 RepID=A0A238FMP6_9BASI|nr:BQ2448_8074 [Microbotryum intermedium]